MRTATKNIIQRNLPLNVKYEVIGVSYISILDGGHCCDNCGKPISNIAEVKSINGTYFIGLDCMDTFIINNGLLDGESYFKYMQSDKPAISKAKQLRAKIMKQAKENSTFKAELVQFDNGRYGFNFSRFNEHRGFDEPMGWDYLFNPEYKQLTINYIKDLPNVILTKKQ